MLSPWLIENIILRIGDIVLGTNIVKQLKQQRLYSAMNFSQLQELQLKKLHDILVHATTTCDAYIKYANIHRSNTVGWLKKFPVLLKKDIGPANRFISNKYSINKLIKYESSGSTGTRSVVYLDKKEESVIRATLIAWWEWNGYYLGKPILQTGMSSDRGIVKTIKDYVLSTTYLNAFDLSEEEILKGLSSVKKEGAHFFGYASSLYEIAKVAGKHNLNLTFDMAMSQGDKLFQHYEKEISKVFNCRVVEDYGLNEGFMVGQKKDLPYFYVYTPSIYLEVLDENNQPVEDGEMGRIILTKLDGYAMPLIRYDTGDLGVMLPKEKYPEKRDLAFPLMEKVIGRNTDVIKTSDGKTLIVHTFTGIFEFYAEISQFQVVQNDINSILIKYIPSNTFSHEILIMIEADFRQKTKSGIGIEWEQVSEIKPSKSGKPQIVVNNFLSQSLTEIG